MIGIDIDKVSNIENVREKILSDPRSNKSLLLGFISPNGNGYKAIYLIDHTKHTQELYYKSLCVYLGELCKLDLSKFDKRCKDVSRTCFV